MGNDKPRKIGFAVIVSKNGKTYVCERIGANRTHFLHAQQMERVMLSRNFLDQMLKSAKSTDIEF